MIQSAYIGRLIFGVHNRCKRIFRILDPRISHADKFVFLSLDSVDANDGSTSTPLSLQVTRSRGLGRSPLDIAMNALRSSHMQRKARTVGHRIDQRDLVANTFITYICCQILFAGGNDIGVEKRVFMIATS
jgi:hypothetical protein